MAQQLLLWTCPEPSIVQAGPACPCPAPDSKLMGCLVQFGQLGLGMSADVSIPARVASTLPEEIADLACGWRHTLAVTTSGKVMSWGRGIGPAETPVLLYRKLLPVQACQQSHAQALHPATSAERLSTSAERLSR